MTARSVPGSSPDTVPVPDPASDIAPPAVPDAVPIGYELPPLAVPVTRTLIVAGALASRDYQDVHHDAEAAREKGSPDIFMNILTTGGLVGRYVTDWAGPGAELRKLAIRLGAPNHPGDTMTLTGRVTALADDRTAEIAVRGTNRLGDHVTGTITVRLPPPQPPASGAGVPS
ncbi:MaoC family dehydratase [Streptomyces sp. P1-3]|uniref:MaoC family dehydratase n=1 Tax=Streptomyces sp. P1-3 TaxID=3421658 RepID=UPI003D361355